MAFQEDVKSGAMTSNTWILRMHLPFPEPEPGSAPESEAHWLYKWQQNPQALDAPEFRQRLGQHYREPEASNRERNAGWWHRIKDKDVFLGSNRSYYLVVYCRECRRSRRPASP